MENFGIFWYGHLEYFTALWYNLWLLGNVVFCIFSPFWYNVSSKSGNPVQMMITLLVPFTAFQNFQQRRRHQDPGVESLN
jgi:hypothetical protein